MRFCEFIARSLRTNEPEWNYYHTNIAADPSVDPEQSMEFIQSYFNNGQKGFAFVDLAEHAGPFMDWYFKAGAKYHVIDCGQNSEVRLSKYRAIHTVSAFFLGVMLGERLSNPLRSLQITSGYKSFPFSYLWFLTCLYHDYGYVVEENLTPRRGEAPYPIEGAWGRRTISEYRYINYIRKKMKMTIPLYSFESLHSRRDRFRMDRLNDWEIAIDRRVLYKLSQISPNLKRHGVRFENGIEVNGFSYSSVDMARYFNYCINELDPPIFNHGIIGGHLFFDRMVKNYIFAYLDRQHSEGWIKNDFDGLETFDYHNRHFCKEQIPVFAYIADCIIAHNVWKADTKSENKYWRYGLDRLMGNNFSNLSFTKNPLLFILAVVDTIEPFKAYCSSEATGNMARSVWQSIDFAFNDGSLTVKSLKRAYPIHILYERAKRLDDWVDIGPVEMRPDKQSFKIQMIPT